MINAEKYKDQLLKFVEENHDSLFGLDKNSEPISCTVSRCNNCQFGFKKNNYIEGYSCSAAKIKWLLSEYKEPVKLSRLEYEILKLAINKSCEYIARDSDGQLFVFMEKPHKGESFLENRWLLLSVRDVQRFIPICKVGRQYTYTNQRGFRKLRGG